jgi:hypothetical protein
MGMNESGGNAVDVGEVRRNLSSVLKVSVGEFKGRAFVYGQLWKKDDGDDGPGERTHLCLTLRPGVLRDLLPLLSEALDEAAARDGRREAVRPRKTALIGPDKASNGPGGTIS